MGPQTVNPTCRSGGRRLLSAECSIVDAANRVLIRSTATYMIIQTDGVVVATGG